MNAVREYFHKELGTIPSFIQLYKRVFTAFCSVKLQKITLEYKNLQTSISLGKGSY